MRVGKATLFNCRNIRFDSECLALLGRLLCARCAELALQNIRRIRRAAAGAARGAELKPKNGLK
jgi:hypothetical protein